MSQFHHAVILSRYQDPVETAAHFFGAGVNGGSQMKMMNSSSAHSRVRGILMLSTGLMALTASGVAMADDVAVAQNTQTSAGVEEVIVTAEKRAERLQDVPVSVSVLNTDQLAEQGQDRLRDYFDTVPGLSIIPDDAGTEDVVIRGISTGGNTIPTVGFAIDGVPIGAAGSGDGLHMVDLDPGDLERIEVLRGPQGTLYGANSLSGLINFVTRDPDPSAFSGRFEGGVSGVSNGTEPGYVLRGSANIPIDESLAIRVSGFDREDPGYIDSSISHQTGINSTDGYGGRFALMWKPSDLVSVDINALYNNLLTNALDEATVAPGLGSLQQNYVPGFTFTHTAVQAYSATVKLKLGQFDLSSITAFNAIREKDGLDGGYDPSLVAAVQQAFGPSATGVPDIDSDNTDNFVQELRLSTTIADRVDVLVGAFYTHQVDEAGQGFDILGEDVATGQYLGSYYGVQVLKSKPGQYDEVAMYEDVTVRLSDAISVQIGGRESHLRNSAGASDSYGAIFGPTPFFTPDATTSADVFNYLASPQWKLTQDVLVYARFSSGYRPGLGNIPTPGIPSQANPDQTQDYEVGLKGDFWQHKISADLSAYYVDWTNLQIQLREPVTNLTYSTNGSDAKSEGLEASLTARPVEGLTLSGWFDYDDAVLTEPFPANDPAYGNAGDRLPWSSRYSADFSAEYEFPIRNDISGFVGGDLAYVGDKLGVFGTTAAPERQSYPAYSKLNLHLGITTDSWKLNFYVDNATDARALVNGGVGYYNPAARIFITPRTIGLDVVKNF